MVEGARLESVCALITHPGFESLPLRHFFIKVFSHVIPGREVTWHLLSDMLRYSYFLHAATVYIIDTCSIPLAINKLGRFARNIYLPTVRTKIFSLENSIMQNIYEISVIF